MLESDARVAEIKLSIAKEADTARESLESQAEALAGQIADAILEPEGCLMISRMPLVCAKSGSNFADPLAGLLGWLAA